MKKIILLTIIILSSSTMLHAARPLIGITGIGGNSPRAMNLANMLQTHISNIITSTDQFNQVNHALLKEELTKFNCLEESCILRFARTAELNIVIMGEVEDLGDRAVLTLYSLGMEAPYFGKAIYSYKVEIPLSGISLSVKEFSYICEEHAGRFFSQFLHEFKTPVPVISILNNYSSLKSAVSSEFDIFRNETTSPDPKISTYKKVGELVKNEKGVSIKKLLVSKIEKDDFILLSFTNKARFLEEFYYGRKREIVFQESSFNDTLYFFIFTIPASATMPFVVPIMGYYDYEDFRGLSLWAVNAAPYLYLEYQGLTNRPEQYRGDRKTISRETNTNYYFGMYMLLFGGASLFVDAFSQRYLYLCSNYQSSQPYMGNDITAAYLSAISGGGGHFYKGHRAWGFLYFHINNILIYYTIREFSREETYNTTTGTYDKSGINRKRAYTLLSVLGVFKITEIVHVLLLKDNIKNGKVLEEDFAFKPYLFVNEKEELVMGASYSLRL